MQMRNKDMARMEGRDEYPGTCMGREEPATEEVSLDDAENSKPELVMNRIRHMERDLCCLWAFMAEEDLEEEAREYIEDNKEGELPFEWASTVTPPRTDRQIQESIKSVIGRLGTLQTESVIEYELQLNPHMVREDIEYLMNGLRMSGGAFFTEYNICPYPKRRIEGDMAIAFWAFTRYAEKAWDRFLPANWPSSIIFRTNDEERPYRITVCHRAHNDENLAVLKNKRWDGLFNEIIVGVNLNPDEVDKDLLPEGNSLTFISFWSEVPLTDVPRLITENIENE